MQDINQQPEYWEARYQAGTTGWDRGEVSPGLVQWIESGDLEPCRIMVPGCGNGYEVLMLAASGFEVVGIDIAPSAVMNLQRALADNHLDAEVIESDFFSLDFTDNPFDAIYEQTCLCALQLNERERFERWLYDSLKTDGKLYSMFMQTNREGGPPFHCDMDDMHILFADDQWQWIKENPPLKMPRLTDAQETPWLLARR